MKRKVIQIAGSTQLISLPKKWAKKNHIKKGDELEITEAENYLIISPESKPLVEKVSINFKDYGLMFPRTIYALYKKGVDEIKINFDKEKELTKVHDVIKNETVGYEIVEQSGKFCIIKNVSANIEGFDSLLRRTFLLLLSMSEEGLKSLQEGDFERFKNLISLEESNNRFTTMCRRYINKFGVKKYKKTGPLYYIIEDLENIADQYKYLYKSSQIIGKNKARVDKEAIQMFKLTDQMLKNFYSLFYKYDSKKVIELGKLRKKLVNEWYRTLEKKNVISIVIAHHMLTIGQKIFNLVGPCLVLLEFS